MHITFGSNTSILVASRPPHPHILASVVKKLIKYLFYSSNVPISDPFIDINWPGRPKRNSFGEPDTNKSISNSNNVSKRQVSTPSPGTASKPPIFPTSPKVIGKKTILRYF